MLGTHGFATQTFEAALAHRGWWLGPGKGCVRLEAWLTGAGCLSGPKVIGDDFKYHKLKPNQVLLLEWPATAEMQKGSEGDTDKNRKQTGR